MRQPPSGTVTFLFTDIEGSTRLWEQHPEAMRLALARHDKLVHHTIQDHGGYVFKTVGDACCAAFAIAPDAVAAALAIQQRLAQEPWETETPLRVRMAIHTGSAEERGGDFFGPPLNRTARLLAGGHGGQILLSLAAEELARDTLPLSAALLDLGECRLTDLQRPERVFQLLHPDLIAAFPPLRSLESIPNNLPHQATSFIGRQREISEAKSLLGTTRLLTLTGTGGSGKTRLALHTAADLLDQYADGIWLVELAALSDPALVPQVTAQALQIKEQAGQPLVSTLIEALRNQRLLLVLDNCEHLLSACASLATELLRSCPNVHILATSRELLNVTGEQTLRVPSLSSPDPNLTQTVEALSEYEAVLLFIERAQAVQPAFTVTKRNAHAVAQVCFHLDGIPLAIELAAARVSSLPVEQINTRLDQRFRLLTGGSRTALPRQQTLRALIDWSYDLLTEQEQALLCRLSIFAGGWTLLAASSVCSDKNEQDEISEDFEMLDLLSSLVDKSLVLYEDHGDGQGRYGLLETVRQYAHERLDASQNEQTLHAKHGDFYLALAERIKPFLRGPEQARWLRLLDDEYDNMRQALAWYGCADSGPGGPEQGLRLAAALLVLWWTRGYLSEGRQRLTDLLTCTAAEPPTPARAEALTGAGLLAWLQADHAEAHTLLTDGLALRRAHGYQASLSLTLNILADMAQERGEFAAAREMYEEALTVTRTLGDNWGIAMSLQNLAMVARQEGDPVQAHVLYEEGLVVARHAGDKWTIAYILHRIGTLEAAQGDLTRAKERQEESLPLRRELGDKRSIAYSLEALGSLGAATGRLQHGALLWAAAAALRDSIRAPLPRQEQDAQEQEIAAARAALDADVFAAAWTAGQEMTLEQALDYALVQQPLDESSVT